MRMLLICCLLLASCKVQKASYMTYIYANYSSKDELEILAIYKDSIYQVFYDVRKDKQYINSQYGKVYLKNKILKGRE